MLAANNLRSDFYKAYLNIALPGVDSGGIAAQDVPWAQAEGDIFRLRIHSRRISVTGVINVAFRLRRRLKPLGGSYGIWLPVNDATIDVAIATSGLYTDLDDCLNLTLSGGSGVLIGAPNGQYKTQPLSNAFTGVGAWPNANNRRVETEFALELIDVAVGDEIQFRLEISTGTEFTFAALSVPTLVVVAHEAPDGAGFMGKAVDGAGFAGPTADGEAFMGLQADGAGALGATVGGKGYLGSATDGAGAIKRKDN